MMRSESIPANTIKYRRCRYEKFFKVKEHWQQIHQGPTVGTIRTSLLHASGIDCECCYLHTSLGCIKARLWLPRNYSHESLTFIRCHRTIQTSLSHTSSPSCGWHETIHTDLSHASDPSCGWYGTIYTNLSHASDPSCGCYGTISRDPSDALELSCDYRWTTQISYISTSPISPTSRISPISTPSIFN